MTAVIRPSSVCTAAARSPVGQHHPTGADDEAHAVTLTSGAGQRVGGRTTRCSSVPHAVVTQPPGSGQPDGVLPGRRRPPRRRRCAPLMHRPAGPPVATRRPRPGRARRWCAAAAGPLRSIRVVPVQRPGSSPVRPSSTCSVAVSTAPSASSRRQLRPVVGAGGHDGRLEPQVERAGDRRGDPLGRRAGPAAGGQGDRRGHRAHGQARALLHDQRTIRRRPRRADRTPWRPGARSSARSGGRRAGRSPAPPAAPSGRPGRPGRRSRPASSRRLQRPRPHLLPHPLGHRRGRRVLAQRDQVRRLPVPRRPRSRGA